MNATLFVVYCIAIIYRKNECSILKCSLYEKHNKMMIISLVNYTYKYIFYLCQCATQPKIFAFAER